MWRFGGFFLCCFVFSCSPSEAYLRASLTKAVLFDFGAL